MLQVERAPSTRRTPGCSLVAAYDAMSRHKYFDGAGIELAMEFELRALETGANPYWSRERLVAHQKARAGRKGGLTTFARYGKPYRKSG